MIPNFGWSPFHCHSKSRRKCQRMKWKEEGRAKRSDSLPFLPIRTSWGSPCNILLGLVGTNSSHFNSTFFNYWRVNGDKLLILGFVTTVQVCGHCTEWRWSEWFGLHSATCCTWGGAPPSAMLWAEEPGLIPSSILTSHTLVELYKASWLYVSVCVLIVVSDETWWGLWMGKEKMKRKNVDNSNETITVSCHSLQKHHLKPRSVKLLKKNYSLGCLAIWKVAAQS